MSYTVRGSSWKQKARGAMTLKSDKSYRDADSHHRGNKENISVCLTCSREECNGKCVLIKRK
jgi:hypothetical protein